MGERLAAQRAVSLLPPVERVLGDYQNSYRSANCMMRALVSVPEY